MKITGMWNSLEDVPPYPMFGEHRKQKVYSASGELGEALTSLARSVSFALSPPQPATTSSSITRSPTKTANLRSKYMEQLSELLKLRENGALSTDEYEEQRQVVVNSMRSL